MSDVVLVCPEPLGSGQPAGIGIRFIEIARTLLADGHNVTVLSPDGGAVPGCGAAATSPAAIRDATADAGAAVVQGHVANDFFAHAVPVPTVVDLYDPFIVENLHYYAERGAEVFAHDHGTLLRSLRRGDFFLCASAAQRLFYAGALLAVGRANPAVFERDPQLSSLVAIAPFGVQPPRAPAPRDFANPAILFGGVYDWYDPVEAIEAVAAARQRIPNLRLTFTTHPNPDLTPQGKLAIAIEHVKSRRYAFVDFVPWVAYAEREDLFRRHVLALMTFPPSIETDLAMRTRVYDCLWAGLPVVTSPAPGTDELLEANGAGVIVRDGSFAAAIVSLLEDRAGYDAMVRATRAFAEQHQWSRTLAPLLAFCRSPRFDPDKDRFLPEAGSPAPERSVLRRILRRMGARH